MATFCGRNYSLGGALVLQYGVGYRDLEKSVALIWITLPCIAGFNVTLLKSRSACAGLGAAQQVAGMSMRHTSRYVVGGFICTVQWMSKVRLSISIFHRHGIQKQRGGFSARR